MIKINLLAEGKKAVVRKAATPSFKVPARDLATIITLVVAVLGLIGAAGRWWMLRAEEGRMTERVRAAQREVDELKPVLKEVADYKAKKEQLERKIAVINQLKENQRGPVRIMDQVSRALPDLLWLDRLDLTGNNIVMRGRAFNPNAIANFLENLGKVPEFQEPVLGDTTRAAQDIYSFVISLKFSKIKPAEQAATPAATGAGG